jgi:hypothetical protein
MSKTTIWYRNEDGKVVRFNGTLTLGDREVPVVDGVVELPDTPLLRRIQADEWDLIKRYDRGEFEEEK